MKTMIDLQRADCSQTVVYWAWASDDATWRGRTVWDSTTEAQKKSSLHAKWKTWAIYKQPTVYRPLCIEHEPQQSLPTSWTSSFCRRKTPPGSRR